MPSIQARSDSPRDETPIFAFWDGDDRSILRNLTLEWQGHFPGFRIF